MQNPQDKRRNKLYVLEGGDGKFIRPGIYITNPSNVVWHPQSQDHRGYALVEIDGKQVIDDVVKDPRFIYSGVLPNTLLKVGTRISLRKVLDRGEVEPATAHWPMNDYATVAFAREFGGKYEDVKRLVESLEKSYDLRVRDIEARHKAETNALPTPAHRLVEIFDVRDILAAFEE